MRYSASSSLYSQVLLSICHADFSIECPTTIKALFLPPVDCQPVMACTVKGILGTDYCPGSLCNDGFQLFVFMCDCFTFLPAISLFPGLSRKTVEDLIAEIGVDMEAFPTEKASDLVG